MVYSTDRSKTSPGVGLTLCCFVVYSTRRFVFSLVLCYFFLCFFSPLSITITSLGKERAKLSAFCTFVRFALLKFCVSSSSWCMGRAAACDCGTPWTFYLTFLYAFKACNSVRINFGKPSTL